MDRRQELVEQAAEHVLEHGLIGLTLRPLAAALGTSDRMLIYHFGSRDALVAEVVVEITARASAILAHLTPAESVHDAVLRLWEAHRSGALGRCQQIYLQAAASGLIGVEPYLSLARESNRQWTTALAAYLTGCGVPAGRAARVTTLVDSALAGFHLDLATDRPDELDRGIRDLATAAQALADAAPDPPEPT